MEENELEQYEKKFKHQMDKARQSSYLRAYDDNLARDFACFVKNAGCYLNIIDDILRQR